MNASELFRRCLEKSYIHVENGGDYATERRGNTLYIYLECSRGKTDWKNNLDFPARPYHRGEGLWFAHRGFLRVWKSVEKHLSPLIADSSLTEIVTVGYSHGAALAVLCHEYVYFHRADLHGRFTGYGFGCPRVYWGVRGRVYRTRWENFFVYRNIDDLVTHVPPLALGYSHVGELIEIGARGRYNPIDAHRPENIYRELLLYEDAAVKIKDTAPSFVHAHSSPHRTAVPPLLSEEGCFLPHV
ncbi:MAG: hypothetical protein E7643_02785 [Ruminococcaceae bacterium]|nr:hypothetical protein [Oscillospiraceae bacterium]